MEELEFDTGTAMWHLAEAASKTPNEVFSVTLGKKTYKFNLVWGPDYRHVKVTDENGLYSHYEKVEESGEEKWIKLF